MFAFVVVFCIGTTCANLEAFNTRADCAAALPRVAREVQQAADRMNKRIPREATLRCVYMVEV